MKSNLDALRDPPTVSVCDGEIVVMGQYVGAAYTVEAARALAALLIAAADQVVPPRPHLH